MKVLLSVSTVLYDYYRFGLDCFSPFFPFDLFNSSYTNFNDVVIKLTQATLDESLYELAGELVMF